MGVVNFVEIDARNLQSIEDSVAHSDIVINCIGVDYDTKNFKMADVNIALAERIAEATKKPMFLVIFMSHHITPIQIQNQYSMPQRVLLNKLLETLSHTPLL